MRPIRRAGLNPVVGVIAVASWGTGPRRPDSAGRLKRRITAPLAGLALLTTASMAQGGGFQLNEHSASEMGRAFSGYGLTGEDVSGVFYNPAAMRYLRGAQTQIGASLVSARARFSNRGSRRFFGRSSVTSSGMGDDGGDSALIPNAFLVRSLNEKVSIGLGITAPFGLSTDYDDDWIGRYHALESELVSVDLNPAVAIDLGERLSVGVGVSAQYAEVTLSRAVFLATPDGTRLPDGFAEVQGDDWSFGFNVGATYDVASALRVGVGYRSKVSYHFKGERRLRRIPNAVDGVGVRADAELPESAYFSLHADLSSRLGFSFGARWTRWSRFDELRVRFDDGGPDDVTAQRWENSWTVGMGLNYRFSPRWAASIGYAFDQTPVPGRKLRTPRIPDADRNWITAGVSLRPDDNWLLQLSAAHLFVDSAGIDATIDLVPESVAPAGTFSDRLVGKISSPHADIVSFQIVYRFRGSEG